MDRIVSVEGRSEAVDDRIKRCWILDLPRSVNATTKLDPDFSETGH